jgi:hypothetical protein
MTNEQRRTCLICGATLVSHLSVTKRRRVRSDRMTCGQACRKRRSRRRAAALALIPQLGAELKRGKP